MGRRPLGSLLGTRPLGSTLGSAGSRLLRLLLVGHGLRRFRVGEFVGLGKGNVVDHQLHIVGDGTDIDGVPVAGLLVVKQAAVAHLTHYLSDVDQVSRMIVFIVLGGLDKLLALLLVALVIVEDRQQFIILHLLEHAVGADVEVVVGLDVGDVHDVGLHACFLAGLHGASDDILLWMRLHVVEGDFTGLIQFVDQRVVARLVEDGVGSGTQVVHAAVADVRCGASAAMEIEEGERGAHLFRRVVVLDVELTVSVLEGFIETLVAHHVARIDVLSEIMPDCLAHGAAGNLTLGVAAHAVAEHKEAIVGRCSTQHGIDRVFLVAALSEFMNGLWL